jgi:aryl-alcohol dehydrogenase-like predicted oxidoreductase
MYDKEANDEEILNAVERIAKDKGAVMAQVSLAWLLSKPFITAPIVGAKSTERIDEIIGSLKVKLSEDDIKAIEASYKTQPTKGFGGLKDGVNPDK